MVSQGLARAVRPAPVRRLRRDLMQMMLLLALTVVGEPADDAAEPAWMSDMGKWELSNWLVIPPGT